MNEIKYFAYYAADSKEKRLCALSASNKIDYISKTISGLGNKVTIISASYTLDKNKGYLGNIIKLEENRFVKFFPTIPWGNIIERKLSVLLNKLNVFFELMKIKKGDKIIVYHSLGYMNLVAIAHRIKKFHLILEVEEIYADVKNDIKLRKKELNFAQNADAYIFSTETLGSLINVDKKKQVIVYGAYNIEKEEKKIFNDDKIHVIYAGTFDPNKGGAVAAIESSRFLDSRYHLHIIGFGTENEVKSIIDKIADLQEKVKCIITYDGCLRGRRYNAFLQSCHIGLSTQEPSGIYNNTSFPSKILSYMSNYLDVVSAPVSVVKKSAISRFVYYYNKQTPKDIADTIKLINIKNNSSKRILSILDKSFTEEIKNLIDN